MLRHRALGPVQAGQEDAVGFTDPGAFNKLEGDLHVQGLLGLDDSVPPGYEQIRIRIRVKVDCPDKDIDDLLAQLLTIQGSLCDLADQR